MIGTIPAEVEVRDRPSAGTRRRHPLIALAVAAAVTSPAGRGTTVVAELPCAS